MRLPRFLVVILGLSFGAQAPPPKSEPVWFWFATCGGPLMTIEVQVHGVMVQSASVPLCRAPRSAASSQGQSGRIDFSFHARQAIIWTGYRETADRAQPGQLVTGSLWLAGADPDALLIGVSFGTASKNLMNTIHIAHPERRVVSGVAEGVTVTTFPTRQ